MSHPDDYPQVMARLAALDAEAAANREEAEAWYSDRCAAADKAVAEAVARVADAEADVLRAERELHQVHGRAEALWIDYLHHAGHRAERFGKRLPDPVVPHPRTSREPDDYLHEVERMLAQAPPARPFTGGTRTLVMSLGVLGGVLAFAVSEGLRWAAREAGGDLAVALPALALVVMLLGPLVGFGLSRLVAERRHVPLDGATVVRVSIAALATAGVLFAAFR